MKCYYKELFERLRKYEVMGKKWWEIISMSSSCEIVCKNRWISFMINDLRSDFLLMKLCLKSSI